MTNKEQSIIEKYNREISDIKNDLTRLKEGKVKEITGVNSDGYIGNNIIKLEKKINDLLTKIDQNSTSVDDKLSEFF